MTRVRDISNPEGDRRDHIGGIIRELLSRRYSSELAHRESHERVRQERFASRRTPADGGSAAIPASDPILPEFFDEPAESQSSPLPTLTGTGVTQGAPVVRARDISLVEVAEDSIVRTRVFPRSVHCRACGHFLVLDAEHVPSSLVCPCCRTGNLVIEPIIFICGRCAAVHELLPPGELIGAGSRYRRRRRLEENLGVQPRCPDCADGHIHLEKHGTNSVARWQWTCTRCESYIVDLQEPCITCGIPGTPNERADFVFMQAIPAAAPNALQALIHQQMFVADEEIDLQTMRAEAERERCEWPDAYFIDLAAPEGDQAAYVDPLRGSCLSQAYLVNDVRVVTTTYGYKAGSIARHPQTPVEPGDRFARFFSDPEGLARYIAYTVSTRGAALVLQFDAPRVMERLGELDPTYSGQVLAEVFQQESEAVSRQEVRNLLRAEGGSFLLYRALHAIEHALLNSAIRQIGNEALGSRLFAADATIMLFEREPIGRGGVVQLVNRGVGLSALFDAARDAMLGCARGCREGCPSCVYVKDPYCTQPLEDLGQFWLPPNSLLSRLGAAAILAPETVLLT